MKTNLSLFISFLLLFAPVMVSSQVADSVSTFEIKIDGLKRLQQLDGIGVNANTRSWRGKELEPALNLLLDSMHATIWRVVVETVEKWEETNDNQDPFKFNWAYYNKLYKTPKFERAWGMIAYLNKKGITDNLMINFMGHVPAWMGKNTVKPEYEEEYVEMIVSFFYYARNTRHLKFGLISPTNEPDIKKEGPELDEKQYASLFRKLVDRMQAVGMGDVRFVGPDPAGMDNGVKRYIPELMKDSIVMRKMAHIGLHSYAGYYANADSLLKQSAYPKTTFWVTEWNAWRDGLDDGKIGVYDYKFASQCVDLLLDLLKNGATGALEWEGYDSYYEHHYPSLFSYWGILGYDRKKKTYSPRKHFYAIQQVSRFVPPGSWQIDLNKSPKGLRILAFENEKTNQLILTGINKSTQPITVEVKIINLPGIGNFEMYHTDSLVNVQKDSDVLLSGQTLKVVIPAGSIFTLVSKKVVEANKAQVLPEPSGWYAGDIHVHINCGDATGILPYKKLEKMMEPNNLSIISALADMGNGEVRNSTEDLKKVGLPDLKVTTSSGSKRIIHWDTEWHWDATYSNFSKQALGGHLVLLGLKNAKQIWEESPFQILEWASRQQAVAGFAHMQYLNNKIQDTLNCCIPIDYPVEAALGSINFVSEDVDGFNSYDKQTYGSEAAVAAYYRLLNCGFKLSLAAGTDFPCNDNEPLGKLLTYVKVPGELTYEKWIEGIRKGNTVVSRDGHKEFLDFKIDKNGPGDELRLSSSGTVPIEIKWSSVQNMEGRIELVCNGKVVATQEGISKAGIPLILKTSISVSQSSWFCARRMVNNEHITHSAASYVIVGDKPIRASREDAEFYVAWIDNILKNISPGGKWNKFFPKNLVLVNQRYTKAREIYVRIAKETTKSL